MNTQEGMCDFAQSLMLKTHRPRRNIHQKVTPQYSDQVPKVQINRDVIGNHSDVEDPSSKTQCPTKRLTSGTSLTLRPN